MSLMLPPAYLKTGLICDCHFSVTMKASSHWCHTGHAIGSDLILCVGGGGWRLLFLSWANCFLFPLSWELCAFPDSAQWCPNAWKNLFSASFDHLLQDRVSFREGIDDKTNLARWSFLGPLSSMWVPWWATVVTNNRYWGHQLGPVPRSLCRKILSQPSRLCRVRDAWVSMVAIPDVLKMFVLSWEKQQWVVASPQLFWIVNWIL